MMEKRIAKRTIILEATLISVAKYGLNVPMSKIVKESGISTGVFYHYFKGKEYMIGELYKKVKLEFLEATLDDYNEQLSYHERFRNIWLNAVKFFIDNPNILILFGQFENAPHLLPKLDSIHYEKVKIFAHFIENGIKEGVFKDLPLNVISDLSIGVSLQVAKDAINGTIVLDEEMMSRIAMASWDAIKK